MPRGTLADGSLAPITNCYIASPCGTICLKILPEISDSKGATYTNENIPGRSAPITTYAYSDQRTISTELHFMVTGAGDIAANFTYMNIIKQLVYPGPASSTAPFTPPPVARLVCGELLDGSNGVCVILRNYSTRFPTDVAWDEATCLPYKFSVSCNWEVVYACEDLPSNTCTTSTGGNGGGGGGGTNGGGSGFRLRRMLGR